MEYSIRSATPEDMEAIITLCAAHAAYEQADYSKEGKKEKLATALFSSNPRVYCLLALKGEAILGYATYMFEYSTWDAGFYVHMDCLFLQEEARGFGIGESLMEEIKKQARLNDCSLIQWQTPAFNERAIRFYRRIGASSKEKLRFYLNT